MNRDVLTAAVEMRRSVRSFNGCDLAAADLSFLDQSIAAVSVPFPGKFAITHASFPVSGPQRPGSYGVIHGACHYIMLLTGSHTVDRMAGGFALEQVVLEATLRGLGTCWIGGTFHGSSFSSACQGFEGLKLVAVMPIGYPAERKRFVEKLTSAIARSRTRRPFNELFQGDVEPWRFPLEMMRLAPSSVNSQPWRAVASETSVCFNAKASGGLHDIDMGIGLSHFVLAAEACGLKGELTVADDETNSARWALEFQKL